MDYRATISLTEAIEETLGVVYDTNNGHRLEYAWENLMFIDHIFIPIFLSRLEEKGFDLSAGRFEMPERADRLVQHQWETSQERDWEAGALLQRIISDAEQLAGKGNASWRELFEFAVIRPLREWQGLRQGKYRAAIIEESCNEKEATR